MSTRVVTGKVRFSYCHLFTPYTQEGSNDAKYSVTLLIPKSDKGTLEKIKQAIADARTAFCEKKGPNALPAKPTTTLYDGDGTRRNGEEFGEECRGHWVITVSSKNKPVIVDRDRQEILDPAQVYSGCYGRACINFFGYSSNGNKGISAGLNSVQKLDDGEPLGGATGSANDFDDDFQDDEEWI